MSKRMQTAVVVLILLIGVALVNQFGGTGLSDTPPPPAPAVTADDSSHDQEADSAPPAGAEGEAITEFLDAPIGPESAPVTVEWFFEAGNDCHTGWDSRFRNMADYYQPHLRLVFRPMHKQASQERSEQLGVNCMMGVAINGEVDHEVPGKGEVHFSAPPDMGTWDWADLITVIERELDRAGVEYTAFDRDLLQPGADPFAEPIRPGDENGSSPDSEGEVSAQP